jgi:hypothetical protein
MSCCGKKRAEWIQETSNASRQKLSNPADLGHRKEHQSKVFEYTGDQNLTLKGKHSGEVYHFRFTGHRIEVDDIDSNEMMNENDLKSI